MDDQVGEHAHYEHLGLIALRATRARLVLAIGGGTTLLKEFNANKSGDAAQRAQWYLVDVPRIVEGNAVPSSLSGLVPVAVTLGDASVVESRAQLRDLHFAATVMHVVSIDAVTQTLELHAYVQLHWSCDEYDPWRPALEWRRALSVTDFAPPTDAWSGGVRRVSRDVHVQTRVAMQLHDYPFESHALEIELVGDSVRTMTISALRDELVALHSDAVALAANTEWAFASVQGLRGKPVAIVGSLGATPIADSLSGGSYRKVSMSICVHRRYSCVLWTAALPTFLLTASVLCVWGVPPEDTTGVRLALAFALLLALVSHRVSTASLQPAVPYLTFLERYTLWSYGYVIAVAVLSAIMRFVPRGLVLLRVDTAAFCAFAAAFGACNFGFALGAWRVRARSARATHAWLRAHLDQMDRAGGHADSALGRGSGRMTPRGWL